MKLFLLPGNLISDGNFNQNAANVTSSPGGYAYICPKSWTCNSDPAIISSTSTAFGAGGPPYQPYYVGVEGVGNYIQQPVSIAAYTAQSSAIYTLSLYARARPNNAPIFLSSLYVYAGGALVWNLPLTTNWTRYSTTFTSSTAFTIKFQTYYSSGVDCVNELGSISMSGEAFVMYSALTFFSPIQ